MSIKTVFLSAALFFGTPILRGQQTISNPFLREAKIELGGSLSGLTLNGKPFDESVLKGKDILLYFGTGYRLPTCANDLKFIDVAMDKMKETCPEISKNTVVVFVAPNDDGTQGRANIDFAVCEGFIVLRGKKEMIEKTAWNWRAQYFKNGEHTQFIYPVHIGQKSRKFLMQQPTPAMIADAFGCSF